MAMRKTLLRAKSGAGKSMTRVCVTCFGRATGRLLRGSHGSGLVEFALVLPLLLSLIFGIFEFGRMGFSRLTARHAVAEATRYAVTGRHMTDPDTGEPVARAESIRRVVRASVGPLAIADSILIDPPDGGGPDEIVTVSVAFTYRYFLPGLQEVLPPVDFNIRTAMKNEPFIE
jgi:hypothetical protein